jgi:hypothetical protein
MAGSHASFCVHPLGRTHSRTRVTVGETPNVADLADKKARENKWKQRDFCPLAIVRHAVPSPRRASSRCTTWSIMPEISVA